MIIAGAELSNALSPLALDAVALTLFAPPAAALYSKPSSATNVVSVEMPVVVRFKKSAVITTLLSLE